MSSYVRSVADSRARLCDNLQVRDDVAKAIEVVEASRRTHVQWAKFLEANPGWAPSAETETVDTTVGSTGHHLECIANYDHVLAVLRGIDPEPLAPPGGHWSRPPGAETPWPAEVPDATLRWIDRWEASDRWPDLGYLHWYDVHGDRAAIPVTHAADGQLPTTDDSEHVMNVWHVEELDGGLLLVSPSVHFIGYWHSPNPVTFHRVDALPPSP